MQRFKQTWFEYTEAVAIVNVLMYYNCCRVIKLTLYNFKLWYIDLSSCSNRICLRHFPFSNFLNLLFGNRFKIRIVPSTWLRQTSSPNLYGTKQDPELPKQFWGIKPSRWHNPPRPQAILQSHSHQHSAVLTPKQIDRPMEQNRESRNKPWHLWSINIWQRRQEYKMGKRQSFQQVLLGNLDSCMQTNETRTHPHTVHENQFKVA